MFLLTDLTSLQWISHSHNTSSKGTLEGRTLIHFLKAVVPLL